MKLQRFYAIGFGALMAFDALAQFSVKFAGTHALPLEASPAWLLRVLGQPWIYGALLGYAGAFVTWMTLLQRAPIGPAFAASHLEIVAVLALSALWLGERIAPLQIVGALMIFAGIVCLAFGEAAEADPADQAAATPTAEQPAAAPSS